MIDTEVREQLGSLVGEIEGFLDDGAMIGDSVLDSKLYELVAFWLVHMDKVKWAYWHGDSKNTKDIIDCYTIGGMGAKKL